MSNRSHWTLEQKNKVARRSFELRNDPQNVNFPDLHCVRQAQDELIPEAEHRILNSTQKIQWVIPYWTQFTSELRAGVLGRLANGAVWVEPKEATLQLVKKPSKLKLKVVPPTTEVGHPPAIQPVFNPEVEKAAQPEPKLSEFPLADLWAELGRRIEDATSATRLQSLIRDEVNAVLDRRLPGILAPDVDPIDDLVQTEPQERKLKICVIGLLNGQQDLIKQEYKSRVDFLLFEKTPSLHKVQQTANHYDFVVQMTKYSNHIKGTNQIDNFVTLGGLLTQLRSFLDRKLTKE